MPDVSSPNARTEDPSDESLLELEVGPVAHGGHCVARHAGRVVFVRHTLPGERVLARLTESGQKDRFWRADAVEIIESSPDRVPTAWPEAGPDGVGGGELAHVSLPGQRAWKRAVIAEQFTRLANLEPDFTVQAAPGDDERGGLGWRTRIELVADDDGRAGMRKHRSHDVVGLTHMPLATPEVAQACARGEIFTRRWKSGTVLEVIAPEGTEPLILADGVPWRGGRPDSRPNARRSVTETVDVAGRTYRFRIAGGGFWQVHREAPALLTRAVLDAAGDLEEATVLDLFSGSGLFTAPLADATGPSGRVIAIEGNAQAVRSARRTLHGVDQAELHTGDVVRTLRGAGHGAVDGADVAVLDPPRAGAGRRVVEQIGALNARRIVYVACDPAALARDVAYFADAGYHLAGLRAFDLFPMTHHVECVAVLTR